MKKSVQQSKTTASAAKKSNGLYVAAVNRRMIIEDMGEQYACRNVDTPDYSQTDESFDENWMPAILTPEEETLYDKYY
ncbi:MAG: hypothetical protein HOP10_14285 [Chitinophagaceae bacterium]|nr:hypothetical protein [Chitinophagaceae bacterium]